MAEVLNALSRDPDGTSDSMRLFVQRIDSIERLIALREEWHGLESESRSTSPFVTWEWTVAWWENLHQDRLAVADSLDVRTVRTREGKLVAVAPMMITRRPAKGPLQFRQLQFFGADPNITELRGLLALPERMADAYRALLESIQASCGDWDWAVVSGVPGGDGYERLVAESDPCAEPTREVDDYVLSLPATWKEFRAGLRRNIKESLRKCYNSLARDGLSFELEVVRSREHVSAALDHFFRLHRARACRAGTVRHPDVFGTIDARRFLAAVCEQLAERDELCIFVLRVDGKVAAVRIGFTVGNSLYLYFSGYEADFAKYSIMTTVTAEAIKYAIENGFAQVNLSPGSDVSKTRWSPRSVVTRDVLMVAPTARGKLMHALYRRGRSALDRSAALEPLKRMVGRNGFAKDTRVTGAHGSHEQLEGVA